MLRRVSVVRCVVLSYVGSCYDMHSGVVFCCVVLRRQLRYAAFRCVVCSVLCCDVCCLLCGVMLCCAVLCCEVL